MRLLFKAMLDGLCQYLIMFCIGVLSISAYASDFAIEQELVIAVICAVISAFIYYVLSFKETGKKALAFFSLISTGAFVLFIALAFIAQISFGFVFLSLRETNNADGLLILIVTGCYLLSSTILKVCVCVARIIKQ